MKYHQYYGDAIWTNHAIRRLQDRGVTQAQAWQAFTHPDNTEKVKNNATSFNKKIQDSLVEVIAKQNDRHEWVIISVWANPPLAGSLDVKRREEYDRYQKASFWGKLWLTLLRQLGF